ncbi:hypothetical protein PP175_26355 (plasmid) [Aneurinibacillus sp. Ricciae_BoGa-3]|uniref:hypothetical protein n=1 Tax=Aneurinibacillus sp. Ricciae_BoGa-3 TaxID=3022697 RepID=UPI0023417132|nr:hypothetical protein [Aneurinibacillus sp. Ricciae_BoGa-3]WCK57590.1 hypothetical protein PP175_26355 [Aneurinibacillus sp. Ricciae_BoGa-3]
MNKEKLMINEKQSVFLSLESKRKVYYVDGVLVKTFEALQKGADERRRIESFDKTTGERRYLDYEERKWFKSNS